MNLFSVSTMKADCLNLPRLILALLVLCFALTDVAAKRLPVKIYTSADGLGSSFVDWMYRDSRGFMWFCTRDGLSRFDGSRFVTYQIGEKDSPPGIESIYETRDGRYWVSTTGGLFRFNPNQITQPGSEIPRINAEYISGWRGNLTEDSRGNLWLSSGGVFRLEKIDGKDEFVKVEWELPPKANITFISYHILEASDGSLWINSSWGLVRRLPDGRLIYYQDEKIYTGGVGAASMMIDKTGRIWLTKANQIWVVKPEPIESLKNAGKVTTRLLKFTTVVGLEPDKPVPMPKTGGEIYQYTNPELIEKLSGMRVSQTSDGTIWISAESNLLEFSGGVLRVHNSDEGLPNAMGRLGEDTAGNLWIGGYAGLARLDRQGLITYNVADGVNSPRFLAVNQSSDGTLYFANGDSYITRFDGTKFENVRPAIEAGPKHIWTSRHVLKTSNGDWWFLTDGKLYRFSGVETFAALEGRPPTKSYTIEDGLKSNGVYQIFEDSDGDIWVSTRGLNSEHHGLARLKKGEERFQAFTEADGFPSKKSPSAFAEDRHGNIWVAFYEGGLARFDGERFVVFTKDLPEGLFSDLLLDGKGRLWAGSNIGGLIRIDDSGAKQPDFKFLTTKDGLSSNNVRTLTEDRFGRIYVGTARGVDRLTPDTGRVKHYSVNDGLAADFVVDSHCDRDGRLWFATNNGVSSLTPLPDEKSSAPSVFIGGLHIAGVEQGVSDLGSNQIEKGELTHIENNLQIDFFGLDFRAGETLRYQYKLEGSNADWSYPTEQRSVTFANLSPGNYRFLVRAVNSEGIFSEKPAVLTFRILPPIWLRWWFVTLCVLTLSLLVFLFYRYRISNLRAINAALTDAKLAEESLRRSKEDRLAELEQVRSRIATDLHDDIGASLTQIAILSEVAQTQNKNGSSEPLEAISNVSNELVGTMSDIVWSINPAKDHFSDLTQRMRRLASDMLSPAGIGLQFVSPEAISDLQGNGQQHRQACAGQACADQGGGIGRGSASGDKGRREGDGSDGVGRSGAGRIRGERDPEHEEAGGGDERPLGDRFGRR